MRMPLYSVLDPPTMIIFPTVCVHCAPVVSSHLSWVYYQVCACASECACSCVCAHTCVYVCVCACTYFMLSSSSEWSRERWRLTTPISWQSQDCTLCQLTTVRQTFCLFRWWSRSLYDQHYTCTVRTFTYQFSLHRATQDHCSLYVCPIGVGPTLLLFSL